MNFQEFEKFKKIFQVPEKKSFLKKFRNVGKLFFGFFFWILFEMWKKIVSDFFIFFKIIENIPKFREIIKFLKIFRIFENYGENAEIVKFWKLWGKCRNRKFLNFFKILKIVGKCKNRTIYGNCWLIFFLIFWLFRSE